MKQVPFKPESFDTMRERLHLAVADISDEESVQLGVALSPASNPKNVFDFEDGMRLVVSKDSYPERGLATHVSASYRENSQGWQAMAKEVQQGSPPLEVMDRWC